MRTYLFGFLALASLVAITALRAQLPAQPPGDQPQRNNGNAGPGGFPGGFVLPAPPVLATLDAQRGRRDHGGRNRERGRGTPKTRQELRRTSGQ